MKRLIIILLLALIIACNTRSTYSNNYYLITDTVNNKSGYINSAGDTVIPLGKYEHCFTDTFRNYAIVFKKNIGYVGINKAEKVLFNIYIFDNGPDYPAEGLFRIISNNKIGYADLNGNIKIKPQFGCAFPFEKGVAKVSYNCQSIADASGEHHQWVSNSWFYINQNGKRIAIK